MSNIITAFDGAPFLVDNEDVARLSGYIWKSVFGSRRLHYAYTTINHKVAYLHRLVIGAQPGQYVDHINRDATDNRKSNLRITTQSINIANGGMWSNNSTGFRGVTRYRNGWKAQVKYHQCNIQSNRLASPTEAALLRDALTIRLFGFDVFLNFPGLDIPGELEAEAERLIGNQR